MTRARGAVSAFAPLAVILLLGSSSTSGAVSEPDDDDPSAVAVLRRAVAAAGAVPHEGTRMVGARTGAGPLVQVLDVRDPGGTDPTRLRTSGAALAALLSFHRVRDGGTARAAGRPADVVVISRGRRVAARVWVDHETGLVLRQEVMDRRGQVARVSSFAGVTVSRPVRTARTTVYGGGPVGRADAVIIDSPRPVAVGGTGPGGTAGRLLRPPELLKLRRGGWSCPESLPAGFRLLEARDVSRAGTGRVVHLMYSNGLSAISVFLQPGRLDPAGLSGFHSETWRGDPVLVGSGWPTRLVWQGQGLVTTLVSDAPAEEVRDAVGSLPHPGGTPVDDLALGVRRVLGALTSVVPGI